MMNKHENTTLRKYFKKNAYSYAHRCRAEESIINLNKHPSREKLSHRKRHVIRPESKQRRELFHSHRREIQLICIRALHEIK